MINFYQKCEKYGIKKIENFKTNIMSKEKRKAGRPKIYTEPTRSLSMQVPVSHYNRLKTILDYELSKLQIKK